MTDLEVALDGLQAHLAQFNELLELETGSLQDINTDTLSRIVQEKNRASEAANRAWEQFVAAAHLDPAREGNIESVLASTPRLHEKWLRIKDLAKRAEQTNKTNSLLIEAQMRRTRQALDVLQHAANRGTLYGADGLMESSFQSGHTLDKV